MKIELNGIWTLSDMSEGGISIPAKVPGSNYSALIEAGIIEDPFIGLNEMKSFWVAERDWCYSRSFYVGEEVLSAKSIELVADMIDTIAEISINGNRISKTDNVNIGYRFDIKPALTAGNNVIDILLRSPIEYAKEQNKKIHCVSNTMGLSGGPNIRKTQCHFGWDWGPILPPSGIQRNIYIEYGSDIKICDMRINQRHTKEGVYILTEAKILGLDSSRCGIEYRITVASPDGRQIEKMGIPTSKIEREILIDNPKLWWTRDLSGQSRQPLYTVSIEVLCDGKVIQIEKKRIGLRTIELDREKDEFGRNFCFKVNGVPIFCKGANWIPTDCFIDKTSEKDLDKLLSAVEFSNMNMLRVWGGGYYESDEFYDLCDERGILVWQDCAFACLPYPFFNEPFLNNVLKEIEYNVKRLRHHASLALWCGNNEIEELSLRWRVLTEYVNWTEKFFWNILESEIRKYDSNTPYTPGSPIGVAHNKGTSADNVGDTHLWAVWHGLQDFKYYRKRKTRFCSEYGFESLPDIKTVKKFAGTDTSKYNLNDEVFNLHQKCNSGNQKMLYYIASRFRLPAKFDDLIYLTQLCQSECIRDAAEFWRRNKGHSNGALYWQLNDCWPVCSWSSIDYYGSYKALQYTARRFFAPVAVSLDDDKDGVNIFILNDTLEDVPLKVKYELINFYGKKVVSKEFETVSKALKSEQCARFDIKTLRVNAKECVFYAEISDLNGTIISHSTVLFGKEKDLRLPIPNIDKEVTLKDGKIELKLTSKNYARFVYIVNGVNAEPLSDNAFDILPGETVIVTMPGYEGWTPEDFSVVSLADVEPKGNKFTAWILRMKTLLKPINFFEYISRLQSNYKYKE